MASTAPIVCKPTAWFLCRATIIFLMFAIFAVLFFMDGSTGYRESNKAYDLRKCFEQASQTYADMNADKQLSPEAWSQFAAAQEVGFSGGPELYPADMVMPMAWPQILNDHSQMASLNWQALWKAYSGQEKLTFNPKKFHDAKSIRNQWVMLFVCLPFALAALFFLVRTSRRSITATEEAIISQDGRKVPYPDMHRLDLRKWDNKGIALVDYRSGNDEGRLRIDGLTYGGFKKEQDQPAERLMELLRSKFSGELLEYTSILDEPPADDQTQPESKPED